MRPVFEPIVKAIHSGTDWTDMEKSLAKMLINKSIDKTEIAYRMAKALLSALDTDPKRAKAPLAAIKGVGVSDSIDYIFKAIKHASGN